MKTTKRLLACMLSLLLFLTAVPARPAFAANAGAPYATTGDVYMRAKPSKDSDAVATLKKGTKIAVTSTSNKSWYKVSYSPNKNTTYTGYISAKWLKKLAETYYATGEVNLRKAATTQSEILAVIPQKAAVSVSDTSNGKWYKATYKNKKGKSFTGFVSSKYLSKQAPTSKQDTKKDTKKQSKKSDAAKAVTYITTGNVYMRSKASKDSEAVTTLAQGTAITVTDTSNGKWYKAIYIDKNKKSHTGYVSSTYLKKKAEPAKKGTKKASAKKKSDAAQAATYVTTGNVNMRSKGSTNSKIVTTLPSGAAVTVTSTSNKSWYKVVYMDKNSNSYTGFVSSKYLKKK